MEDFVLAEIIVNAVPVSMVTNARKVRMIILLSLRLCTITRSFRKIQLESTVRVVSVGNFRE